MKIIKDPVHGYVEIDDIFLPLLDSPELQRLRHIRQLGFAYLVYPGANHSRFEHSLGTMHLAGIIGRQLGLGDHEKNAVIAAALLHDIGHGPFSHASEPLMEEFSGHSHQEIGSLLDQSGITTALQAAGIETSELVHLVTGRHPLAGIIHGSLDADRMDYLVRDAHYTGAPYGTVDTQRLVRHLIRADEGLVIDENGINAAESLLIARTLMRSAVYFHHVSRIAHSMFSLAMLIHLKGKTGESRAALLREDDSGCLHALLQSDEAPVRELARRLYSRDLYKRAIYVGRDQVNTAALQKKTSLTATRALAEEIAEIAVIDPFLVLVDIPSLPGPMAIGVQVRNRNTVASLDEVSPIVTTLNETRRQQWRLGVYTVPEYRKQVADAAIEVLHVKRPTLQGRLVL